MSKVNETKNAKNEEKIMEVKATETKIPSKEADTKPAAEKKSTDKPVAEKKSVTKPDVEKKSTDKPVTEKKSATKPDVEKKTAAKKTTDAKNTEEKEASQKTIFKTTAKKAVDKKTTAGTEKVTESICIQYAGREIEVSEIMERAKAAYAGDAKKMRDIKVYVKPEENMAYFVVNGEETGSVVL